MPSPGRPFKASWRYAMTPQSDQALDHDSLRRPWPSLAWIVFAVAIAVTALMLAPVPA
jgi:hypothetical protein